MSGYPVRITARVEMSDGTVLEYGTFIELLDAMAATLRKWPAGLSPFDEWDPSPYLPGGDRYIPKPVTYGTPVCATAFIAFDDPEEIAERERREAAGKVLAVLLEAAPKSRHGRVRRLKAEPWPAADTLAPGEEAPAAMISDRAQGGRSNAVLPARVEPGPLAQPCASCALGVPLRLPPLGFPLVPLSVS